MTTAPQLVQLTIEDLGDDAEVVEKYIWELQQRIAELEAQVPKWVSVEDEMPDEGVVVLVKAIGYEVFTAYLDSGLWEYIEDHIGTSPQEYTYGDFNDSDITHWMPLPQPPKESDDE